MRGVRRAFPTTGGNGRSAGVLVASMAVACGAGCSSERPGVEEATVSVAADLTTAPVSQDVTQLAHVPSAMVDPSCVHEIPNGATVGPDDAVTLNGVLVAHYDECPSLPIRTGGATRLPGQAAPQGPGVSSTGWIEGATASSVGYNAGWTSMSEPEFVVPNTPSKPKDGQTIFLWIGMENSSNLIQPVLQYGQAAAGGVIGGNFWTYAGWLATSSGNFYHTTGFQVYSGDDLSGSLGLVSQTSSNQTWYVAGTDITTSASFVAFVGMADLTPFAYAQGALLESNGPLNSGCSDFPSSTALFTIPTLSGPGGAPTWSLCPNGTGGDGCWGYTGPDCSFNVYNAFGGFFLYE
jgi:hypothetical protein